MRGRSSSESAGGQAVGAARSEVGGFTLIELIVVLVVLGLLASIALPRFSAAREKAYQAQMQNDLRSLATAEEAYFDVHNTYTTSTTALEMTFTDGVDISIGEATGRGWSATASHVGIDVDCGMYYGNAAAPVDIPVPGEGVVACD